MTEIFSKIEKIEEAQAEMSGELLKVRDDVTKLVEMVGVVIDNAEHSNNLMSQVSQEIGDNLGSVSCGIESINKNLKKVEKQCTIAPSHEVEVIQVAKASDGGCSDGNYINMLNTKNANKFRFFCTHVSNQNFKF